jgi:hypothetical protein
MATLRRKHLSPGTYFIWRCEKPACQHQNGKFARASESNDAPVQGQCPVEIVDAPPYDHVREVAAQEVAATCPS